MKLHLGCGGKHWPGFVNVDMVDGADVQCDIRTLPFEDGYADEVHAIHVIEHFWPWDVENTLKEWARVLKPGGRICLELPCLDKVLGLFARNQGHPHNTYHALYGDPGHKREEMTHKWCYPRVMMRELLEQCGFVQVTEEDPFFHRAERDMR